MTADTSQADFLKKGPTYAAAYEILARGCEVPPSLEQFDWELEISRRKNPSLAPEQMARRLSESYHCVKGLFGGDG